MLCAKYDYKMDIAVKQEEAYEDGAHDNAVKNAKNLLKEGDSPEKIARCTGLPLEDVQKLADEMKTQEKL